MCGKRLLGGLQMIFDISKDLKAKQDISLNRQTLGYVKNSKNFLKNTATTQTINGMKITVNDDGSMVFNGTTTKITEVAIGSVSLNGDFILSGAPEGAEYLTYKLFVRNSLNEVICRDYENDGMFSASDTVTVYVNVNSGITLNNLTFYPMIRSIDITDPTFEPYVDDVNTRLKKVETEVIPIERGGTGGTTAKEAQYNLLNDMNEVTETIGDETRMMFYYGSPSQGLGGAYYRKAIHVWNYIKSKAEAIFAPKTQLGGCYLKYENGKFYIGHDDSTTEV